MRRASWVGWLVVLFFVLGSQAWGQCISRDFDYSRCNLCTDSWCDIRCYCVNAPTSGTYFDGLQPGLFTTQADGRFMVATVIPGSPAEKTGIRPGDEIVSLNGRKPLISSCLEESWHPSTGDAVTNLVVRRGGRAWEVTIPLVPVRSLLEAAWNARSGNVILASTPARADTPESVSEYRPYITGLRWIRRGTVLLVTQILPNSPADISGMRIGDQIVAVDGQSVSSMEDKTLLEKISSSYSGKSPELTIRRAGATSKVGVQFMRATQILRDLGRRALNDPQQLASAGQ